MRRMADGRLVADCRRPSLIGRDLRSGEHEYGPGISRTERHLQTVVDRDWGVRGGGGVHILPLRPQKTRARTARVTGLGRHASSSFAESALT